MKNSMLIFFLLLLISSCHHPQKQQDSFDKTKWSIKDKTDYPYRENMLQDLVYNVKLKGLKKVNILDLLGQPDRTDSNYLFYTVAQERIGALPLHTRTLVIKFINDTVEWRKIKE